MRFRDEKEYQDFMRQRTQSLCDDAVSTKPSPIIPKPRMNTTEQCYANEVLNPQLYTKEILDWRFEDFGVRLADRTFYYCDFFVTYPDRFECHEIKGRPPTDDSLVKFKSGREKFPYFTWRMIQRKKGEWVELRV